MRALRVLLLAAASGVAIWPQTGAGARPPIILYAWPIQGHSGDTIYMSGSGFLPDTQLAFVIACPNIFSESAYTYHNWELYGGPPNNPPVTNQHGDFAGYPIKGFQLNPKGPPSSPCTITARYPDQEVPFVCDQCALYDIAPPSTPIAARYRLITGHVKATPQQVHAGLSERISVTKSWGGATAAVYVRYPHQSKARKVTSFHLDWEGNGNRLVPIDQSAAQQPGVANVSVAFTLGPRHGTAATSFTVVR